MQHIERLSPRESHVTRFMVQCLMMMWPCHVMLISENMMKCAITILISYLNLSRSSRHDHYNSE